MIFKLRVIYLISLRILYYVLQIYLDPEDPDVSFAKKVLQMQK